MNKVKILSFIFNHCHNNIVQRKCIKKICLLEGGEAYSKTARDLFEKTYGLHIGYGTYGGIWTSAQLRYENLSIGNYCSIASNVNIYTENHPTHFFSSHPIMYNPDLGATKSLSFSRHLSIGNDVWIGQNVIILPGCHSIGNGAVIGAGSIVTKDVEPYTINVGNPAKPIKKHFSETTIQKLEATRWWVMEKDELLRNKDYLQRIVQEDKA